MENKIKTSKKEVLVRSKGNLEALYYLCLFFVAFVASVALLVYAVIKQNKGLSIYSYFLVPTFFIAALVALRFYLVSIDPIYTKGSYLIAKKALRTRKISFEEIDKITVGTFGNDHRISVNIIYGKETVKYQFKKLDKECAAKLRKLGN